LKLINKFFTQVSSPFAVKDFSGGIYGTSGGNMDFGIQPAASAASQQVEKNSKTTAQKAKSHEVSSDKPEAADKAKTDTPTTQQVHESQKAQPYDRDRGDNTSLDLIV
jgi:hypothetical protein